jgi:hypothetical protein
MSIQKFSATVLFLASTLLFSTEQTTQTTQTQPKLILQITVDQLRGDLPDKFMNICAKAVFVGLKRMGSGIKMPTTLTLTGKRL